MARMKMVYVSEKAHRNLRLLAAKRNLPMGKVVEALVEADLADLDNAWTDAGGLELQQRALARLWDEASLDVYGDA